MKIPMHTKYPRIYKALRLRDTRIRPIGWVSGQNRFIGNYEMNYCYKITGYVPFVTQVGYLVNQLCLEDIPEDAVWDLPFRYVASDKR